MMFYIRTAEKLQRTSVWMDNLEGGIDYLKEVIMNDKLGINDQLEKDIGFLIENYSCEWKDTVEDSALHPRFAHFINTDQRDDNLVYTAEREQPRPATFTEKQLQMKGEIIHMELENQL